MYIILILLLITSLYLVYKKPEAKLRMASATIGTKAYFAGGDIYDTLTDEWTTANLSARRFLISVVTHGSKVLFAGGLNLGSMTASNVVDIYDVETGDWDTAYLSEARFAMGEAVVGDIAVFAGGDKLASFSDRVDLYNFTTNTWSTESLFLPRGYTAAAGAEDKVMVVGGMTDPYDSNSATNVIEIYDLTTGTWSFGEFPNPRAFIEPAVTIGNKVYFAGGGKFLSADGTWTWSSDIIDIYNIDNGNWSVDHLTHGLTNHTVTSLETLEYELEQSATVNLSIYNNFGQKVAVLADGEQSAGKHQKRWNAEGMPAGIYYY